MSKPYFYVKETWNKFQTHRLPFMEEFKGMPPLLGRLGCNLVKIGILEEVLNPSTMNNLEGRQHNPVR